jgi:glycerol-3-phosphate acyltransferase PlsX
VLGVQRPQVGLLNIGEEKTKGTDQLMQVNAQLSAATSDAFEFIGNVEGRQFAFGECDVVVTDGFTGNVALKFAEAVSAATIEIVDTAMQKNLKTRIGGRLINKAIRQAEADIDPELSGGAYLLGLRKLGVVPHGRFDRHGIALSIEKAARSVDEDVVGRTHSALEAGGALRRTGLGAVIGGG